MDDRGLLDHWIGGNFSKVSLLFFYVFFFFGNLNYDFAGKVELVLFIEYCCSFQKPWRKKASEWCHWISDRKFFQNWKVGSNRDDDSVDGGSNGGGCPFFKKILSWSLVHKFSPGH